MGRLGDRFEHLRFSTRLSFAILAAFALVAVSGYALMSRQIEARITEDHLQEQRTDARSFAAIGERSEDLEEAIEEVGEVLSVVDSRPGTVETLLIDAEGMVRAAGDENAVGEREDDPQVQAALKEGAEYAGTEADQDQDGGDLEFIVPVRIMGRPFAYEVAFDQGNLEAELRDARNGLAWIGLLMLLVGGGTFYVAGGRALMRSHRSALQRATRDGLTDLPNQRAFHRDLPAAVETAVRHGDSLVLMLLDADDFKFLNDRHGHAHGDEVLRRIAGVLSEGRAGDTGYRLGGDEFALLLRRTDAQGAQARTRRLLRALNARQIKMSIGVAELSASRSPELLQREADAALYEAKRRGGNRAVHIDEVRSELAITTTAKLDAIHRLLEDPRLDVAYQPIWNLRAESLLGLEALARPHADYGFEGPAEAFDLAEQIGQVAQLDKLCVTTALRNAGELPEGALLFLNLHPQTLDVTGADDDWLLHAVCGAGLDPARVVIEVTERFGARTGGVVKALQRLRDQRFKIALDDVGTGNSGLEMLRLLETEFVKLDRGIVSAAPDDATARAVLMAMATFASHTGACVIAEGLEDEDALEFIRHVDESELERKLIIQCGQGYGLGRPSFELNPLFPGAPVA